MNADRTALFLVDGKNEELYAQMFSVGPDETDCVERKVETEVMEGFVGCSLKEVVSYKGNVVRSANVCTRLCKYV